MDIDDKKTKRSALTLAALWSVIGLLALTGVTYAWFTFSSSTRITPMAGAIGKGGVELLISDSENGEFGQSCRLPYEGNLENLQPVSTADMQVWCKSVGNDTKGIANRFK